VVQCDLDATTPTTEVVDGDSTEIDQVALRRKMLKSLRTLDFDSDQIDGSKLVDMVVLMAEDLGITQQYRISSSLLRKFVREVRAATVSHQYHNWAQSVDKVQMLYYLLVVCEARTIFQRQDILAMLLAALTHNIDHPSYGVLYLGEIGDDEYDAKNNQTIFKKFYEEHLQSIIRVTKIRGCEILANIEAYDTAVLKGKIKELCSIMYYAETRMVHDQPDKVLKTFHEHADNITFAEGEEAEQAVTTRWMSKERHPNLMQFFFCCVMRLDFARPLPVANRRLEALISESIKCGGTRDDANFSLDRFNCSSEAEGLSMRRDIYLRLKFYIEETVEVPLISLIRVLPKFDQVLDSSLARDYGEETPQSLLGTVIRFRQHLWERIRKARLTSDDEGLAPKGRRVRRASILQEVGLKEHEALFTWLDNGRPIPIPPAQKVRGKK